MKLKFLTPILAASLFAVAAHAQVDITITGSTAFRSVVFNRVASLFDNGSVTTKGNLSNGPGTYSGTLSNLTTLGSTPVTIRLSFSGSGSGMIAVNNSTPVVTVDPVTGNNSNRVPDIALSDVFPESATPSIDGSAFDRSVLGVIPFVFIANNNLYNQGVTNLTREQAILLLTASGVATVGTNIINGMPATYLGGTSTNPVYMTGRDSGSGTRITVLKDVGFTGTPTIWATNGAGQYVLSAGYSSGGAERDFIQGKAEAIGYLGEADALVIAANAKVLSYNGALFSHTNTATGQYPIWGYEHIVNRAGGLSTDGATVRDALIGAITNPGFQATNTLFTASFVSLQDMKVERGGDGAPITSKEF